MLPRVLANIYKIQQSTHNDDNTRALRINTNDRGPIVKEWDPLEVEILL